MHIFGNIFLPGDAYEAGQNQLKKGEKTMITKFDRTDGNTPADSALNTNTESTVSPFASYPFYSLLDDCGKAKEKKGKKGKKEKKKSKKRGKKQKSSSGENDDERQERAQARERELIWRNGYLTAQNETFRTIINMSIAASQGRLDTNVAQVGLSLPPPDSTPQTSSTLPPQSRGQ